MHSHQKEKKILVVDEISCQQALTGRGFSSSDKSLHPCRHKTAHYPRFLSCSEDDQLGLHCTAHTEALIDAKLVLHGLLVVVVSDLRLVLCIAPDLVLVDEVLVGKHLLGCLL